MPGIDYSDAPEQRSGELIPDGTFVKLVMNIRPGGVNAPPSGDAQQDASDASLFTASKKYKEGDHDAAVGLDCEYIIEGGLHNGRRLYTWDTIMGGALDDKGNSKAWNMTKQRHRAMIDSALGLDPKDMSVEARTSRQLPSFSALHGIGFWAKVGVEPGNEIEGRPGMYYDSKNSIERVVVPGDPEYAELRAGKEVPPKPKGVAHTAASASAPAAAKQAWGNGAAVGKPPTSAAAPAAAQGQLPASTPAPAPNKPAWLNK